MLWHNGLEPSWGKRDKCSIAFRYGSLAQGKKRQANKARFRSGTKVRRREGGVFLCYQGATGGAKESGTAKPVSKEKLAKRI